MFGFKGRAAGAVTLGSALVASAGFGVSQKQSFMQLHGARWDGACRKFVALEQRDQHARRMRYPALCAASVLFFLASLGTIGAQDAITSPDTAEIVVSATRIPTPEEETPASVSVITADDFVEKQTERVGDALRQVPGLSVVQSGTAGQLTSVFTRGLRSEHTQVLIDGVPINQGLAGLFNFADLTVDDLDRIEVVRGPQSTVYGPRALAGVIQLFTKQGEETPATSLSLEGGSYDTFRETLSSSGKIGEVDYSFGGSRLDTDNARPNNQYRLSSTVGTIGWSPNETLRLSSLFTYSLADTGNPNTIFDPKPLDNFLTERWLIAPHLDWKPSDEWEHKLIIAYDHERQVNDPNEDGFVGPTRALFERLTIDYQNDFRPAPWLTLTSGFFFSDVEAGQERPFVSQAFGPQPTFISDHTQVRAVFLEASATPLTGLNLVAGGRFDDFNQFGGIFTYRFAGSYRIAPSNTILHASVATGFSPPSSQDKIFGNNFNLEPEKDLGWEIGVEQRGWDDRIKVAATYFHNDLTNLIGFNGLFDTLNLGAARTQGVETELRFRPIDDLLFSASYTYLDAQNTGSSDISQLPDARLPRRPRQEVYVSGSYLWFKKLRTTAEAKWVNAREDIDFSTFQTPPPNFDIEDYSFINFAAEYQVNAHLTIFGRVDNLTNEHYSEVFGFPALGRAAYGGVRLSF
ncbi:MAG: TonB-dependent receptor [Chthoniobacterales bacterium]|nr:TonB-dependent receptor [Chthoniobacterales bacterium]